MERKENQEKTEALIEDLLPPGHDENFTSYTVYAKGREVWSVVKMLIEKVNTVKISVWHGDRPLFSVPVLYGGVFVRLFPYVSILSMISLIALDCKIVVLKRAPGRH